MKQKLSSKTLALFLITLMLTSLFLGNGVMAVAALSGTEDGPVGADSALFSNLVVGASSDASITAIDDPVATGNITVWSDPDPDYISATNLISLSDIALDTLLQSVTDTKQTITFDKDMKKREWKWAIQPYSEGTERYPGNLFSMTEYSISLSFAQPVVIFGCELDSNQTTASHQIDVNYYNNGELVGSLTRIVPAGYPDDSRLFAAQTTGKPFDQVTISTDDSSAGLGLAYIRYQTEYIAVQACPDPVQYSDMVRLTAVFRSELNPVADKKVVFEVNGRVIGYGRTNSKGVASVSFKNQLIPCDVTVTDIDPDPGYEVRAYTQHQVDGKLVPDLIGTSWLHVTKEQATIRYSGPGSARVGRSFSPYARIADLYGDYSVGSYAKVPAELTIYDAQQQVVMTLPGTSEIFGYVYFAKATFTLPGTYTAVASIVDNDRYETWSANPVTIVVSP